MRAIAVWLQVMISVVAVAEPLTLRGLVVRDGALTYLQTNVRRVLLPTEAVAAEALAGADGQVVEATVSLRGPAWAVSALKPLETVRMVGVVEVKSGAMRSAEAYFAGGDPYLVLDTGGAPEHKTARNGPVLSFSLGVPQQRLMRLKGATVVVIATPYAGRKLVPEAGSAHPVLPPGQKHHMIGAGLRVWAVWQVTSERRGLLAMRRGAVGKRPQPGPRRAVLRKPTYLTLAAKAGEAAGQLDLSGALAGGLEAERQATAYGVPVAASVVRAEGGGQEPEGGFRVPAHLEVLEALTEDAKGGALRLRQIVITIDAAGQLGIDGGHFEAAQLPEVLRLLAGAAGARCPVRLLPAKGADRAKLAALAEAVRAAGFRLR